MKSLRYNEGKIKWSMVDFKSLHPLVRVLEYGAHKYSIFEDSEGNQIKGSEISQQDTKGLKVIYSGKDNWKINLDSTEILESLMRHLEALFAGEKIDPESGLPHIAHVLCNAMFYSHYNPIDNDK